MVINSHHKIATVRKLPYDAEVEWLSNGGTAYIDSGIYACSTISFSASVRVSKVWAYCYLMGWRNDWYVTTGQPRYNFFIYFDQQYSGIYYGADVVNGGNNHNNVRVTVTPNTTDFLNIKLDMVSGELWWDNDKLSSGLSLPLSKPAVYPSLKLFATDATNTSTKPTISNNAMQVASASFSIDGNLVRDFIPVRFTNEQGQTEGAMYDKVSGQLFRNQGSGSFVMGPDVIPYDAEVEFLESTGTQYIDTGVVGSDTLDIRMLIECNKPFSQSYQCLFGCMQPTNYFGYVVFLESGNNILKFRSCATTLTNTNIVIEPGTKLNVSLQRGKLIYNGSTYYGSTDYYSDFGNITLLCRLGEGVPQGFLIGKLYSSIIYKNGQLVRDFIPVRIGTTGYMYDRANPKGGPLGNGLYPNQGSGDFILGKDVAYPKRKFEVTFRKPNIWIKPITARDYVQDGLIAMWDGIENAGWGTHDGNATVWKNLISDSSFTDAENPNVEIFSSPLWTENSYRSTAVTQRCLVSRSNTYKNSTAVTIETVGMQDNTTSYSWTMSFESAEYQRVYEICRDGGMRVTMIAGSNNFTTANTVAFRPSMSYETVHSLSLACMYSTASNSSSFVFFADGAQTEAGIGINRYDVANFISRLALLSIGNGYGWNNSVRLIGEINSIRLYSRALSAAEIAHNYAIDKVRFGLP